MLCTFCVTRENGEYALVIGGLQGPRRSVSRDVIKQATRACHGQKFFPKRVLMEPSAFPAIAHLSGMKAILRSQR